jgi:integrase
MGSPRPEEWITRGQLDQQVLERLKARTWVYPHVLPDGRVLGDFPVNQITREQFGSVIRKVKTSGRSLAIIEQIRNPLRTYYQHLIETKTWPGPNPAADLKYFIGKGAHQKARTSVFFTQQEGPVLMAVAEALHPRWSAFILTGLLAGLRWGESAALMRSDIDFKRGRLHVQRTISGRGAVAPPKNGKDRWVKASPALLQALRGHLEAIDLDGSVKEWSPEQRQVVFPTTSSNLVRYPFFLEKVWKPLLKRARLPYRPYHSTRHTFATWLLEVGADIRWVQRQLGHASIGQTADTYGHQQPERHEAAVGRLDEYVK